MARFPMALGAVALVLSAVTPVYGQSPVYRSALHDFQLVRQHFPETLFLARKLVGLGPTAEVLKSENIRQARHFHEAWEENAPWCEIGTVGGDSLTAGTMLSVSIDTVKKAWKNGLETALRPAS